jgi:hypothetical protein
MPVRRTDRVEDLAAWLLVSLGMLAALGAALVGHAAYGAALDRGHAGGATAVRAVLLADAAPAPGGAEWVLQRVPMVWTDEDGTEHTVEAAVRAPLPAGSEITIWLDGRGQAVSSPPGRPAEAVAFGAGAGLTAVALAWALLGMLWCLVRRVTGRRNAAAWAREWAQVEPMWSGRVR